MKRVYILFNILFGLVFIQDGKAQNWEKVGDSFDNYIRSIIVYKGYLYAGGEFTKVGSLTANYMVKWNGTTWENFGQNINGFVNTSIIYKDTLYIGGTQGGNTAFVKKWNGQNWISIGKDFNGYVNTLIIYNDSLYAGGGFTKDGEQNGGVKKWDGKQWSDVGSDLYGVASLGVYNDKLYAGGCNLNIGGEIIGVAKLDGNIWKIAGTGTGGCVNSMLGFKNALYVGGSNFLSKSNSTVAKWDGSQWTDVGAGPFGLVGSLVEFQGSLYAGRSVGSVSAYPNSMTKWDGNGWEGLGLGLIDIGSGSVQSSVVFNDIIYAGVRLNSGHIPSFAIKKWVGKTSSINEKPNSAFVKVFPNPNPGLFSFETENLFITNIEIFDAIGRKIFANTSFSKHNQINLSDVEKGICFYKITFQDGTIGSGKIVIEK